MEQVLAASKSALIDSLDFSGPPPVADYVNARQQSTFFPQGGNQYSPTGVRQIRFALNTVNGFLDMSTIAFQAVISEKAGQPVQFLGGNWGCCVTEMRIYCAGVEVERIQYQNRLETQLERFMPSDKRIAI